MPGPAAFAVPGAILAMKRIALQASAYYSPEVATAFTSATIIAVLTRWIWKYIPIWIKEDISFQTLFWSNKRKQRQQQQPLDDINNPAPSTNAREELSHLASVLQSLNRMTMSMEELHEIPQLHAAILAFIQLSAQMKQLQLLLASSTTEVHQDDISHSTYRDDSYETAGHLLDLRSEVQTPQHQEALEFATWAYHPKATATTASSSSSSGGNINKSKLESLLQERDYELVCHEDPTTQRPGQVAFYVAVSGIHRQVYVGVRGTSSLEDLVTDCCGHAVPLMPKDDENWRIEVAAARPNEIRLSQRREGRNEGGAIVIDEDNSTDEDEDDTSHHYDDVEIISGHEQIRVEVGDDDQDESDNHVRCHEGILISAKRMTKRLGPILRDWALDAGYRVILCGHSLGGGVATLAALILRAEFPSLEGERMHVYAFAPPPVLDHDSAIAAAPFVTSFVHNADLIPRCSLFNLAILMQGLKVIHEKLKERGINPTGPKTTTAFIRQLFASNIDLGVPIDGDNDENVADEDEGQDNAENDFSQDDHESMDSSSKTPAHECDSSRSQKSSFSTKPLLTLEEWNSALDNGMPSIRKREHLFVAGRVLLIYSPWKEEAAMREEEGRRQQETTNDENDDENDDTNNTVTRVSSRPLRCVDTNGTAAALRMIEADGPRLFTDHFTSSYYDALGMTYHFD